MLIQMKLLKGMIYCCNVISTQESKIEIECVYIPALDQLGLRLFIKSAQSNVILLKCITLIKLAKCCLPHFQEAVSRS